MPMTKQKLFQNVFGVNIRIILNLSVIILDSVNLWRKLWVFILYIQLIAFSSQKWRQKIAVWQ